MKVKLAILFIVLIANQLRGQKVALIIGNGDYQYLESLRNATNDAEDFAQALGQIDFKVDKFTNLTKEGLKTAIKEFQAKAKNAEIALFYYAGHGIEISGKNYFVPVDAFASAYSEIRRTCIPTSAITHILNASKTEKNIIILDACRSNPFKENAGNEGGLALMDAPTGTIISFATAPGRVAFDGKGRNGLYTAALLDHILTYDIEIKSMFEKVRNSVVANSNNTQIPWESTSLTEDIVLRRRPELPIQVSIVEGDTAIFEQKGELHAVSNLKDVSFTWYYNGRQFSSGSFVEIDKTGSYLVKGISRAGQILISKPINITIKSFINLNVYIEEGSNVTFEAKGVLHGKTNVLGDFRWRKDNSYIGNTAELEVELPGKYNFQVITADGRIASSEAINVKINK